MTRLTKSLIASLLLMALASLHAAEQMPASVAADLLTSATGQADSGAKRIVLAGSWRFALDPSLHAGSVAQAG